jgi:regulator of protease activity HflC (stomatin/prohibitin superfamily)
MASLGGYNNDDGGNPMKTIGLVIGGVFCFIMFLWFCYTECRIEVPGTSMAILYKKTGLDYGKGDVIAPTEEYKGVQKNVLGNGRYYRNPYVWDWEVVPQIEIPEGKLGVRIRLYGEDLPAGELIAWKENQKGIVPEVLNPARYAINAKLVDPKSDAELAGKRYYDSYAEIIELHDPVTIPAGFLGVKTELSSPLGKPNVLLSEKGKRGTQEETLEPSTYYLNPYITRVDLIDVRSQRYNLSGENEVGFPTRDGFWVTLDGIIEFRPAKKTAAKSYVIYNEAKKQEDSNIDEEIIKKVILPNARSYARLRGSNYLGRDYISGETRTIFQKDFQEHLKKTCAAEGVDIIQALVTRIEPPKKIAEPVRQRQIAKLQAAQFVKETEQQLSEQELATQKALVLQKSGLVDAAKGVIEVTTMAKQKQEVALIEASQRLAVAEQELKAAQDLASAIMSKGQADADVIMFANKAQAAGWETAVKAFGGDGDEYARYVLLKKLAPAYKKLMVNKLPSVFSEYNQSAATK